MQKPKLFLWKEKWNLTQYDVKDSVGSEVIRWYRVRKTWQTASRRKEPIRFWIMRRSADQNPGYKVFDADGKVVYEPKAAAPAGIGKNPDVRRLF